MKVRHRILRALIAVVVVGATLMAAGSIALIRGAVRDRFIERMHAENALLAAWLDPLLTQMQPQALAEAAAAKLDARVTLIDAQGVVIAESSRDGVVGMDNHGDRPEIRAARSSGTGESYRTSATTNVEYFYSARRVEGQGPVEYVRIAMPSAEVSRVQRQYTWLILGGVPAMMLLLAGLGYASVRRLSRPVEEMADAVQRSAGGELQLELPREGGEEIERLSDAVSQMRRELLDRLHELGAERALLSSVVEGMQEGLLLVGTDRRVRLTNATLRRILELEFEPEGHPLSDVVRHPTVIRDIDAVFKSGVEIRDSILRLTEAGQSFQLRVSPLGGGETGPRAVLVLFFDVTRLEKLEGVRREFVANVSHELRTPLTAIKAFVENLVEGSDDDPEARRNFLQIVRKHADRMESLIDDLTDLSLIETGAVHLELSEIDAREVVEEVLSDLQPRARQRDVELVCDVPAPFVVHADMLRLVQMLTNLVDNAVKFSREHSRVRVRGRAEHGRPTIVVEDEGIGIPAESLEKIFNRFYQTSRDRSGNRSGTGLGLAIVKHLMRLHGGKVRVESELGAGSRFYLEFPPA